MFVCTVTSARGIILGHILNRQLPDGPLSIHECVRGVLSRIQSDRREQLAAASKQIGTWNFEGVREWARKKGIEWHLVPTVASILMGKPKE
jgi:hypothetical protein